MYLFGDYSDYYDDNASVSAYEDEYEVVILERSLSDEQLDKAFATLVTP